MTPALPAECRHANNKLFKKIKINILSRSRVEKLDFGMEMTDRQQCASGTR